MDDHRSRVRLEQKLPEWRISRSGAKATRTRQDGNAALFDHERINATAGVEVVRSPGFSRTKHGRCGLFE
jgi:hypothetical protein